MNELRDPHIRTEHLHADLRARSVRGAAVSLATRAVSLAINFVSLAVLARLLGKEDFGLVFAVTAVTGLISSLRDFGLGTATLQRQDVSHRQVSTLFWINVSLSIAVMLLTMALAPVIVWTYGGDARLAPVTLAFGAMSILVGLEVQHRALLQRQMQFGRVAAIDLAALAAGGCIAVAAALGGAGYWALVVQSAAAAVVRTGGVWAATAWRPGLPGHPREVRPLLFFGGNLTLGHVVLDVARNFDRILIARFVGQAATGIYGNAYRLLLLPANHIDRPLTAVAVATLGRLQNDPKRFRSYYRKAMLLLASAALPFALFVFVAAEEVVLTVLGAQWHEAVLIVRILTPAALVQTLGSSTAWVYAALGRTDRQARWATFGSLVRVLAVLVGAAWGTAGVAVATSLSIAGLRYWGIRYCFQASPLALRDLGSAIWRPTVASIIAGACLFGAGGLISPGGPPVLSVLRDLTIFSLAYLVSWTALPGGRRALREVTGLADDLRPVRGAPAAARRGSAASRVSIAGAT